MGNRWSGLYLKVSQGDAISAMTRLVESRGYKLVLETRHYDESIARRVIRDKLFETGNNLEPVFFLSATDDWNRMIGFEQVDVCSPRLVFNSELVVVLGCDAFECGFLDTLSWWYVYYENGRIIDRFDSDPKETYYSISYDRPFDPNDLREIYRKCEGLTTDYMIDFPSKILNQYEGIYEKLSPILRKSSYHEMDKILREKWPEKAISRLGEIVILPYIGQESAVDLYDDLYWIGKEDDPNPSRPFPSTLELVAQGLALILLQHPKARYQADSEILA